MTSLKEPIPLAEYIFRRLKQCGVHTIQGVPGDFNLSALDFIPKAGLRWAGSSNELNAGYAADGYARLNHLSVLFTTFGVGELSATNAIAGAYSERVPLIHLVGTPSTISQRDGMLLHHTLGNGDFTVFSRIYSEITCGSAALNDPTTAAGKLDDLIRKVVIESRPGYVTLPTDMVHANVEGARLREPLDLAFPPNDKEREDYVVEVIEEAIKKAERPCIIVDVCVARHRASREVTRFVAASKLPVFVTPMGKSTVDESRNNFGGVYVGVASEPEVKKFVESSDLVISIGSLKSDMNTAGFSGGMSQMKTIELHSHTTKARHAEFPGIRMHGVLEALSNRLEAGKLAIRGQVAANVNLLAKLSPGLGLVSQDEQSRLSRMTITEKGSEPITHDYLWPRLSTWLQPADIVVTETGTSNFGITQTRFPLGVRTINQILWGSIGYATGAAIGAAFAVEDAAKPVETPALQFLRQIAAKSARQARVVLFTGDGSFQLTAQEISTALRNGLAPIVFVLQNKGYTIERYIHGMEATYNDIPEWEYVNLPQVFGGNVLSRDYGAGKEEAAAADQRGERAEDGVLSKIKSYLPGVSSESDKERPRAPRRGKARVWVVKTREQLERLLADDRFANEDGVLRMVELHMPWDDAPQAMAITTKAMAKVNDRYDQN